MSNEHYLKTRVPEDVKARVHALADQEFITESIWLKRLVMDALRDGSDDASTSRVGRPAVADHRSAVVEESREALLGKRVCIRLTLEDRLLLRERAAARGLPSATYVSVLVRSHLRHVAPLPRDEYLALRSAVSELGAIGRNINQIARAANRGDPVVGPSRADLFAMLKVCEAMRDHVKGLLKANLRSWNVGHDERED